MKAYNFVPLLERVGLGDFGRNLFRCILSLNWVNRAIEISFLCATCSMCCISYIVVLCRAGVTAFFL